MSHGNSKKIYALCGDMNKNNVFYQSNKHTDIYEKNFYRELENNDEKIKGLRRNLTKSKETVLKESTYSNIQIPKNWKSKLDYKNDVLKVISRDKLFFNYLYQKSEKSNNKEKIIQKSYAVEKNEKDVAINTNIDEDRKEDVLLKLKKVSFKKPIETSTYYNSQVSKSHRLSDSNYKLDEPFNLTHKSSMLKTSIYTNILPQVTVSDSKIKDNKEYGFFLNTKVDKKAEITDAELKKKLESIKFYGPNYSHCLSCKNRNIEFYDSMNLNSSLKLIDYIKQVRIVKK